MSHSDKIVQTIEESLNKYFCATCSLEDKLIIHFVKHKTKCIISHVTKNVNKLIIDTIDKKITWMYPATADLDVYWIENLLEKQWQQKYWTS